MSVNSWEEEFSDDQTFSILRDLAQGHIARIANHELRSRLTAALDAHCWSDLCDWNVDYLGAYNASDLIELRQVLGFYQKLSILPLPVDKRAVAREKFLSSEAKCRETNKAFQDWASGRFNFLPDVDSVLHAAQRKIARVLGPVPSISQLDLAFGPGATTTVKKRNACPRIKLSTIPSCTTNLLSIAPSLLREVPHWSALHASGLSIDEDGWLIETVNVEISHGKLSFVPKNAKTDRSVLTEPTLNAMLQAGYGKWIAKRLLRVGQDITDQSRNQRLARDGSLTGDLATLDLSSASDSIAIELVAHLLPYDWYAALSGCRTPTYTDGESQPKKLAKFSSMGNGFTFPLQTLIFWALVSSIVDDDNETVSVYGDDIICPVSAVKGVKRVFDAVGFELNMSKSYWDGGFRESCGADYYFGIDIRPFYQKRRMSFESLFVLHNFYVRKHDMEMANMVLGFIPEHIRLWGPEGYGDGHLIGDWKPRYHNRSVGWGGYLFDTYVKLGRKHRKPMLGDRVLPLYCIYQRGVGDIVAPPKEDQWLSFNYDFHWTPSKWWSYIAPEATAVDRKSGVAIETLPGSRGYKRISIYTFTRP